MIDHSDNRLHPVFAFVFLTALCVSAAAVAFFETNETQAWSDKPTMPTTGNDDSLPEIRTVWNFSDPAGSEAAFRVLLPRPERAKNASYRLQLLTQIARAQGLARKFDEAHRTLDEVQTHLDAQPPIVRVRYLLERGRVFNSSGKRDEAQPLFVEAWELGTKSSEDFLAVDAAHMVAIVVKPDESLAWNEKAMQLAETSPDMSCRNWLGSLYNNIGWTYHDKGDYEKALASFEKALEAYSQQKRPKDVQIAKWTIARALRSLNRVEEALARQQALLKEHEKDGTSDGFVYEELAECHLILKHEDEAKKFFKLAFQELAKDEWLAANEPKRLERLKSLGEVKK